MLKVQDELKKLMMLVCLLVSSTASAQLSSGKIARVGDTTHLEMSGLATWAYDLKRIAPNQIELSLPAFDEKTEVAFRSWADNLVTAVTVDKNGPDNKYIVRLTLAKNEVEAFDYLTDDPSRLIVDIFMQEPAVQKPGPANLPGQPMPEKKTSGSKAEKGAKGKASNLAKANGQYEKINRKPASSELLAVDAEAAPKADSLDDGKYPKRGIWDGNDPNYRRFLIEHYQIKEDAIIASQQNIYLRFPRVEMPFDRFADMMKDRPEYEVVDKDSDQNKEARFLLSLYHAKKFASFKKVYDYFMKKYPDSAYDEIVRNLNIEMHIDKYLAEGQRLDLDYFRSELRYLDEKYPTSPLRDRNFLLLSYSALKAKESLEALELLKDASKRITDPMEKSYLKLAQALAYVELRKPADAKVILNDLESTAASTQFKVESAYRMGDVDLNFKDFKSAEASYKRAMTKYPDYLKVFPNALYNLAESQFWQKEYEDSLQNYVEFLRTYPTHEHGGFAMTRAGELLDILGADQSQVMSVYLESYFRYPKNEGSEIARIRMLAQGFKSMKDKEKRLALAEIEEIRKTSSLPRVDEFVTLTVAEGRSKRGEFRESLKDLLTYYQTNPTTADAKVFRGRILRNISEVLKTETEKKSFMEALNFYGSYSTTWLKNSGRLDVEFYRAQAFEQAGVYAEAQNIYRGLEKKRKSIQGTTEEKERNVYEHLPSYNSIELRLAAVALELKGYRDASTALRSISGKLSPQESVEKAQIGAEVATKVGDLPGAAKFLNDLIAGFTDNTAMLAEPYVKLGRIYFNLNRPEDVATVISAVENLKAKGSVISDNTWSDAMELKADLQVKRGEKLAAVETYLNLLDQYETKRPMQSVRYKAGLLLFEENDVKGAEKIWSALEAGPKGFYSSLAKEKVEQSKWQDSYRKYVDRIPAADQLR